MKKYLPVSAILLAIGLGIWATLRVEQLGGGSRQIWEGN
jgi:hypothetical protein